MISFSAYCAEANHAWALRAPDSVPCTRSTYHSQRILLDALCCVCSVLLCERRLTEIWNKKICFNESSLPHKHTNRIVESWSCRAHHTFDAHILHLVPLTNPQHCFVVRNVKLCTTDYFIIVIGLVENQRALRAVRRSLACPMLNAHVSRAHTIINSNPTRQIVDIYYRICSKDFSHVFFPWFRFVFFIYLFLASTRARGPNENRLSMEESNCNGVQANVLYRESVQRHSLTLWNK